MKHRGQKPRSQQYAPAGLLQTGRFFLRQVFLQPLSQARHFVRHWHLLAIVSAKFVASLKHR